MDDLFERTKKNLILEDDQDDALLHSYLVAAVSYAEGYQHLEASYYATHEMSATTEQAVIMLASHLYESRDGSTAGFFGDNVQAAQQSWDTINRLLRMDRDWRM